MTPDELTAGHTSQPGIEVALSGIGEGAVAHGEPVEQCRPDRVIADFSALFSAFAGSD